MATTIGEVVSRLRNGIKAVKEDAFITDRYLYSIVLKYAKTLVRRQDNENKIKNMRSLFETLPCVELEETDKIDACCSGIRTDCKIMRTKDKLPTIMEGSYGPIIRSVSTIDDSLYFNPTFPQIFVSIANSPNYRYNKTKYFWFREGRLYFPNVMYDAVNVEALWEDSTGYLKCEAKDQCIPRQLEKCPFPDYLFGEIEQFVARDLGMMVQMPNETQDDKQSPLRT